ncbi:MAG: PAS domain S-box protein [Candidatus Eremiobacterota bacterium]
MEDKNLRKEIETLQNRVRELEENLNYSELQRIKTCNISESLDEKGKNFRNLIENTTDLLWETDKKGVFIYVSPQCKGILGYSQEEITGKTPFDFMTYEESIRIRPLFEKEISHVRPFKNLENTFLHRDGYPVVFETSGSPVFNSLNESTGYIGICRNITTHKEADKAIRESEENFRRIIEHIPSIYYSHNTDNVLTYLSPQAKEILDCEPEQALVNWQNFLTNNPLNREAVLNTSKAIETGERQKTYMMELLTPAGKRVTGEIRESPVVKYGRTVAVVGTFTDVTEKKKTEEALIESEKYFRKLIDLLPLPMFVMSSDNRVEYLNSNFTEILGYTIEDIPTLKEWSLNAYPDPEYRKRVMSEWEYDMEHFASLEPVVKTFDVTCKNGTVRKIVFRPVKMENDKIFVIFEDITICKKTEEELVESGKMLQLVLDTIPARVFWKDRNSVLMGCNRLLALDAGLSSPEEIIGKSDFELIWKDEAEHYRYDDLMVMETGKAKLDYEESQTKPDGKLRYLRTSKIPLYDREGHIVGLLGTYEDITDRKKSEEERRKLEKKMEHTQKLESLGILAGGIAHDFNNLLVAILGNAELALLELPPGSPAQFYLSEIENTSLRSAELCKQMLAYAGKGRLSVEPLNMSALVREMSQMLEVSISRKAIIRYKFQKDIPLIEVDATQIRQVIMNLIINASEAIKDRDGLISVSTGSMFCDSSYMSGSYLYEQLPERDYVYLEISDTGTGMDKETQMKIFDPFFTTKFTGRGLGLAAVLGIVRGHKGFLKLYSEPEKGTSFKVFFPALKNALEGVSRDVNNLKNWYGKGTVLLVDDDQGVLDITGPMLKKLGFNVLTAMSGQEALKIISSCQSLSDRQEELFACIILDFTMPHMDGEETFHELRKMRKNIPVILSSGYSEQEVLERFSGKGPAAFLQKPYKLDTLIDILQKVLPS